MRETSWVDNLIKNTPLAVIIVGLFLFVVGAAGGWPSAQLQIHEPGWRIALAAMGVVTSGIGGLLIWRERTGEENDKVFRGDLNIKITFPFDRQVVTERFNVEGSYKIKPPDGIVVVVLEFSPNSLLYYPKREVSFDEKRKIWQAPSITLKGSRGDERILVAATMRRGNALWAYFHQVSRQLRDNLNNQSLHIPGFANLTPDIIECDRITVKRES